MAWNVYMRVVVSYDKKGGFEWRDLVFLFVWLMNLLIKVEIDLQVCVCVCFIPDHYLTIFHLFATQNLLQEVRW